MVRVVDMSTEKLSSDGLYSAFHNRRHTLDKLFAGLPCCGQLKEHEAKRRSARAMGRQFRGCTGTIESCRSPKYLFQPNMDPAFSRRTFKIAFIMHNKRSIGLSRQDTLLASDPIWTKPPCIPGLPTPIPPRNEPLISTYIVDIDSNALHSNLRSESLPQTPEPAEAASDVQVMVAVAPAVTFVAPSGRLSLGVSVLCTLNRRILTYCALCIATTCLL
jgi:hypothetical protein